MNMYDAACYLSVCTCLYMHLTGATNSKDVDAPAWITKGVLQKIHSFLWPAHLGLYCVSYVHVCDALTHYSWVRQCLTSQPNSVVH